MGSPMALTVNQLYQFALGYQGAVSQINYQIDFGDGTKTGWFPGILNSTTTVSHVFTRTGQFAISVAARSISAMKVNLRVNFSCTSTAHLFLLASCISNGSQSD